MYSLHVLPTSTLHTCGFFVHTLARATSLLLPQLHTCTSVLPLPPQEILNLFSKVLNVRLAQLQLARPAKSAAGRKRILVVDGLAPQEVFDKMQDAMQAESSKREGGRGREPGR